MNTKPGLVTIDDDRDSRAFIRTIGTRLGFAVTEVSDPSTFAQTVRQLQPAVVVLDLNMPNSDGITLMRQLRELKSEAYVLAVSGCDTRTLQTVSELGRGYGLKILGTVQKPATVAAVEQLLRSTNLAPANIGPKDLQDALNEGHVKVHYQPKLHRRDGEWRIGSVEALARWHHPQLGPIPPLQFVKLAEESGLIGRLTDTVMNQSLQQVRLWGNAGIDMPVAVNLSPLLVADLALPDRIRGLLQKYRVESTHFAMEVTESAAITDSRDAMDVLTRLRVLGIGLAIDDFGTGSSSLLQLFRMPFNELKIDQCFVMRIPENDEARRIVKATVDLAHAIGISACAEGVESQAVLDYLRAMGCDMAQGYHISAPVVPEKIPALVAQWNPGQRPAGQRAAS
ncbi:MAG: EAL domain-containing response regulator [Gammaproteobacteria bacterium]|nr:EAL domain-containing response regulator [Gammaproteobacteria bacterium]